MSSAMACIATRLMSSGAAKSGKPCERLTAPYFIASRVISRITDSVNRLALCETWCCLEMAGVVMNSYALTKIAVRQTSVCRSPELYGKSIRYDRRQTEVCRTQAVDLVAHSVSIAELRATNNVQ